MNSIIIADSGPLIALSIIEQLNLLSRLFDQTYITKKVANECTHNSELKGATEIAQAIKTEKITINQQKSDTRLPLIPAIDTGERSAIELAIQEQLPLLIDHKMGRKVSKQYGLKIIGTAGLLMLAKKRNLIPKVIPHLETLRSNGYYFSKSMMENVATLTGEVFISQLEESCAES